MSAADTAALDCIRASHCPLFLNKTDEELLSVFGCSCLHDGAGSGDPTGDFTWRFASNWRGEPNGRWFSAVFLFTSGTCIRWFIALNDLAKPRYALWFRYCWQSLLIFFIKMSINFSILYFSALIFQLYSMHIQNFWPK